MKNNHSRQSHTQNVSDATTKEVSRLRDLSYDNTVLEIQKNQTSVDAQSTKPTVETETIFNCFSKHNLHIFDKIMQSDEPTKAAFSDYNEDFEKPISEFEFLNN